MRHRRATVAPVILLAVVWISPALGQSGRAPAGGSRGGLGGGTVIGGLGEIGRVGVASNNLTHFGTLGGSTTQTVNAFKAFSDPRQLSPVSSSSESFSGALN